MERWGSTSQATSPTGAMRLTITTCTARRAVSGLEGFGEQGSVSRGTGGADIHIYVLWDTNTNILCLA